jgi:predicted transcriptional regulator
MTIQIPDDLTRGLEELAAAQKKSAEQVADLEAATYWTRML